MRKNNELRPLKIKRAYTRMSPGSVLIQAGNTTVLCTASVEPKVPDWLKGKGKGWITAEYNMLPHSTSPRKARERGLKVDGRTTEIQRLIGRSLRSVANLAALGERSIQVDCDVIEADTAANAPFGCVMASRRASSSSVVTLWIVTRVRCAAFSSSSLSRARMLTFADRRHAAPLSGL